MKLPRHGYSSHLCFGKVDEAVDVRECQRVDVREAREVVVGEAGDEVVLVPGAFHHQLPGVARQEVSVYNHNCFQNILRL